MDELSKPDLQEIVDRFEASHEVLDREDRLRYAMARSMCCGKDVSTPDMKRILLTLTEPEGQTAGQLRAKLLRLFLYADLTGSELTYDYAKQFFARNCGMPFGEPGNEIQ